MRYLVRLLVVISCLFLASCDDNSHKDIKVIRNSDITPRYTESVSETDIPYSSITTETTVPEVTEPMVSSEVIQISETIEPTTDISNDIITLNQDYVEDLVIEYIDCNTSDKLKKFKDKYGGDVSILYNKSSTSTIIKSCAKECKDSSDISYIVTFDVNYENKVKEYKSGTLLVNFSSSNLLSIEVLDFY